MIEVRRVEHADVEVEEALARLIPQLSSTSPIPRRQELEALIASDSSVLLAAKEDGGIIGLLTLVLVRIPTGVRARIEDVVVDERARGRGVGEHLSREAIRLAAEGGAKTVDLTSRPGRRAANRLYERLGFERRDTHVYRYNIEQPI
jgi:ribosomal protein S18 acetylase RimI-like enzyme